MRIRFLPGLFLTATLAMGCEFELTEVEPSSESAPYLNLTLLVREHRGLLQIFARFDPGRDGLGRVRDVKDDSLRIDGLAFAPIETAPDGERRYMVTLGAQSGARRIRYPKALGVDVTTSEILVDELRLQAVDSLLVDRSGNLELRLTGLTGEAEGGQGSWDLAFSPSGCKDAQILTLRGSSAPLSVLLVSMNLLPVGMNPAAIRYSGMVRQRVVTGNPAYTIDIIRSFIACIPLLIR